MHPQVKEHGQTRVLKEFRNILWPKLTTTLMSNFVFRVSLSVSVCVCVSFHPGDSCSILSCQAYK